MLNQKTFAAFALSMSMVAFSSVQAADQVQDRDRLQDQTGDQLPDRDRVRDQLKDGDQTRDRDQLRDQLKDRDPETVYGSQLMTPEERAAFRAQIRNAKTVEEREQIRAEHHKLMRQRAKEKGIQIPDEPPMERRMQTRPAAPSGMGMGRDN